MRVSTAPDSRTGARDLRAHSATRIGATYWISGPTMTFDTVPLAANNVAATATMMYPSAGRGWTSPRTHTGSLRTAGRSSAWLECCVWDAEVAGSNPAAPTLVVLLAASAAFFFGALAVTIRFALARGIDAEAASLVTTVIACVICATLAFLTGDFADVAWKDTWPFFVTGLFAPGISQILFTRAVGVIGPSRTAIIVGISPVLSAAIAVTILGEPLHVALVFGTLLVVLGGTFCSSASAAALPLCFRSGSA